MSRRRGEDMSREFGSKSKRIRSTSPPNGRKKYERSQLKKIRITFSNNGRPRTGLLDQTADVYICEIPFFSGPENALPGRSAQQKFQIEVRRNLPKSKVRHERIRRSIQDPATVVIVRRKNEGKVGIFDSIIRMAERGDKKTLVDDRKSGRSRSRSPNGISRDRNRPGSVRDRLGRADTNRQRVLNREELESQRPRIKPWDVNPEFVPRNYYYFEHDNRDENPRRSSFGGKSGKNFRGHGQNTRWFGDNSNRGHYRSKRASSPVWKHDKFLEVNEEEENT